MTADPYTQACEEVQRAARLVAAEREFVRWANPGDPEKFITRIETFADSELALWQALREMHVIRIQREREGVAQETGEVAGGNGHPEAEGP